MEQRRDTLAAIAVSMGLNRNTLYVVFSRYDKRGKPRPQPVGAYGPSNGVQLYDADEVEEWYAARQFEPRPVRGPDLQPRKITRPATT